MKHAMPKLELYHYPLRACSHVTFNALEEAGLDYDDHAVDIRQPDRSVEHLQVNPEGKVPVLVVDGEPITENPAILIYLDMLVPEARLLPSTDDPFIKAKHYADLAWISSTFHPAIRQVRMPSRFTDGDPSGVQAKGLGAAIAIFDRIENRVQGGRWWYGDDWSIVDAYICWAVTTAASSDLLPMEKYPAIQHHIDRVRSRASHSRAIERQIASKERFGIEFPDEWKPV